MDLGSIEWTAIGTMIAAFSAAASAVFAGSAARAATRQAKAMELQLARDEPSVHLRHLDLDVLIITITNIERHTLKISGFEIRSRAKKMTEVSEGEFPHSYEVSFPCTLGAGETGTFSVFYDTAASNRAKNRPEKLLFYYAWTDKNHDVRVREATF